jgi:hypothetical protein
MTEENTQAGQASASQAIGTAERSEVYLIAQKSWLTGPFGMAICCAAPLLLVAAVTLFGISLGALASGFLSLAVLVACPVGMYLMMRMMAKQNAGRAKDGEN